MDYKRILFISHDPFISGQNIERTIASFFQRWPQENLAQLYFAPQNPSFSFCRNFFCITDFDILHANLACTSAKGRAIVEEAGELNLKQFQIQQQARAGKGLFSFVRNQLIKRNPFLTCIQEAMWRKSKFKSATMTQWINHFKPDAIFFIPGSVAFGYQIAIWISEEWRLPLYTFLTDDYTYIYSRFSPFAWINHARYMRAFKRGNERAKRVFVIGNGMKEDYLYRYGLNNTEIAVNSIPIPSFNPPKETNLIRMFYAGNLNRNRWEILILIGKSLLSLKDEGLNIVLDICSLTPLSEQISRELNVTDVMRFHGAVSEDIRQTLLKKSDVMVNVESFDRMSISTMKLSISTKIPEYMASSRCIFFVGPEELAVTQYLKELKAAIIVTKKSQVAIEETIRTQLTDYSCRVCCAQNAYFEASKQYDQNKMIGKIENIINDG